MHVRVRLHTEVAGLRGYATLVEFISGYHNVFIHAPQSIEFINANLERASPGINATDIGLTLVTAVLSVLSS